MAMDKTKAMILSVTAHPKSGRIEVKQVGERDYHVWVKALPDRGEANEAIIDALAEYLNISRRRLMLHSGSRSKRKLFKWSQD